MFFPADVITGTKALEDNWRVILEEYQELSPSQLEPWPERNIYEGKWDVFGLHAFGTIIPRNCQLCPKTAELLLSIPDVVTAGYSLLGAKSRIIPHVGYTSSVLRVHLGLIVPPHCSVSVGEESRTWTEGRCLVFDDTAIHWATNDSDQDRIVFLLDIKKLGAKYEPPQSKEVEEATSRLLSEGK